MVKLNASEDPEALSFCTLINALFKSEDSNENDGESMVHE